MKLHSVKSPSMAAFTDSGSQLWPGANPTIANYNASVVNFYNAMGSLARFENQ
jgi:hypothetical protein